jgi:hypothetical protein
VGSEQADLSLRHAEDALQCFLFLQNQSIIQSNAIPIMPCIATLALCFMNPKVFQHKVKVHKAKAALVHPASLGGSLLCDLLFSTADHHALYQPL